MFQKSKAFPFHSNVLPQHKRQIKEKNVQLPPKNIPILQSRAETQKLEQKIDKIFYL